MARPRGGAIAAPAAAEPGAASGPRFRVAWGLVGLLAALYPLAYIVVALRRMGYPFELEWMEGGMVDHVRRVLAHQPLYIAPSLSFTPFTYPPLYYELAAPLARLMGGAAFAPLRLFSFLCSLASFGVIFLTVRRDTGRALPAALAACLFAASFREGGAWFDLARVDSLHLLGMAAGILALRVANPARGGALAGLCFGLAALTKQSALFIALPVGLWLVIAEWRRGIAFLAALALVAGGASLALDRASHGWYLYYVFELPRSHPIIPQLLRGFWTSDLLGTFAIALTFGVFRFAAARRSGWRRDGLDLVVLATLILTSYVTKIRVGSFTDLLMPAHLAASLAFGWGLAALLEFAADPGARGAALERFALVLALAQFVLCAYKPWRQIPPDADRVAGRQFVESLRRVPGPVWIPSHPYLAEMAGKPEFAHVLALTDVLRPGPTPQHRALLDSLRAALRARRFDLVILDDVGWLQDEVRPDYDHVAQMFGKDETRLFWPMTGYYTRPDFVWAPKRDSTGAGSRAGNAP